jgi:uncharacterized membrane protein (UPF0182 family)
VPLATGIGFLQPAYHWRPESVPSIARVATLVGDSAHALVPPTSVVARPPDVHPAAPGGAAKSATALYSEMKDALRRGDWAAFGRAFDALGRVLEQGKKPR